MARPTDREQAEAPRESVPQAPFESGSPGSPEAPPLTERIASDVRERLLALDKASRRVRGEADDEAVHDLRVATRRLGAALRLWGARLEPGSRRRALVRLRRLRQAFGPVRDLEIQRAALISLLPELPDEARVAGETIVARLEKRLRRRRAALARRVRPARIGRLDRIASRALRGMPSGLEPQEDPLAEALRRIEDTRRRFGAKATEAVRSGDTGALHELRILAKKSRYALECLGAVLGVTLGLDSLRALQRTLGEIQDGVMLERTVMKFANRMKKRHAMASARALAPVLERIQSRRSLEIEEARRLIHSLDARELFGPPLAVPGDSGGLERRVSGSTRL